MTVKADELALWEAVKAGETPRKAGARLGIHPKRVIRLCEKWADRGDYNYGVAADLGWAEVGEFQQADLGPLLHKIEESLQRLAYMSETYTFPPTARRDE